MTGSTPRFAPKSRWDMLGVVEYTFMRGEQSAPTTIGAEFDDKEQCYNYFIEDASDRRVIDSDAFAELRGKALTDGELVSVETRFTYNINGAKTSVYCYRDYTDSGNSKVIVNRC